MKINQIPRQDDVIKVGFGAQKISVVSVTDENKDSLAEAVFSTYLGEKCKYCDKKYNTISDLKDTVWVGDHKHGRLACRSCVQDNKMFDITITNLAVGSKRATLTDWVKL
jgi:hypothetical protein